MADKEEEKLYYTMNVEFSDEVGQTEEIHFMVKNNHVYVNAEELAIRLGYQIGSTEEYVLIYNCDNEELPYAFTKFYINTAKVVHTIFLEWIDTYEAPFETIKNAEGIWIPFDYSLLILNSSKMLPVNKFLIDNTIMEPVKKSL